MALSQSEKDRVINLLDNLSNFEREIALSSIEAFTRWLLNAAYYIYQKIREGLSALWQWLAAQF